MRFAQYFIEKNEEGVLAFINRHGFLDNPTFRASPYTQLQSHSKIAYFGACTCLGQKRNSTQ
jgi:hypothetical protein